MEKSKLKGKFIVVWDTIVDGWECSIDESNNPVMFDSYNEAFKEIFDDGLAILSNRTKEELEEYNEGVSIELVKEMEMVYDSGNIELMKKFLELHPNTNDNSEFVIPATEFIFNRKSIFGKEGLKIIGN